MLGTLWAQNLYKEGFGKPSSYRGSGIFDKNSIIDNSFCL